MPKLNAGTTACGLTLLALGLLAAIQTPRAATHDQTAGWPIHRPDGSAEMLGSYNVGDDLGITCAWGGGRHALTGQIFGSLDCYYADDPLGIKHRHDELTACIEVNGRVGTGTPTVTFVSDSGKTITPHAGHVGTESYSDDTHYCLTDSATRHYYTIDLADKPTPGVYKHTFDIKTTSN
ncbi:hypothetical protein NGB58_21905 [Escherichia coli]|nr:hypothetical protein [Escherichia coli]